ncbi:MAG: PIN domain-containing protein [Alphaproteobacteria bacterium]|nr:PIN domain-containing protein [Alphaproteobacteria bacterium]MBV9371180.1 PIN domain-containing protein [Alphaproteobacteria bacterium]MBV9899910.1 PIN domain-containing protein [Alphaproteobacteria bacterium]
MTILVDTNVFSEITKPRPDPRVVEWLFRNRDDTLLSTIVVAELAVGIRVTRGEHKRALLLPWLECLVADHVGRIVAFELAHAVRWGEFAASVLISDQRVGSRQFDTLIAAQAIALRVPLATRNVRDFEPLSIRLINPWAA